MVVVQVGGELLRGLDHPRAASPRTPGIRGSIDGGAFLPRRGRVDPRGRVEEFLGQGQAGWPGEGRTGAKAVALCSDGGLISLLRQQETPAAA